VRNEVGVAEYPDGRRYAIAVFTRTPATHARRPDVDRAIGDAARAAVESLR
jgi:beta-lactamase class A